MARQRKELRSATKFKLAQIVRLQALDKPIEEIAALLNMTPGNVSDLIKHKEYETLRDRYLDRVYQGVDDMIESRNAGRILTEASPDAAEALVDLLFSEDSAQQRMAADSILDRSGHGRIQHRAIRQRIELDPVSAALLASALKESAVDEPKTIDVTPDGE